MSESKRLVVVGGGWAGIAAAMEGARHGFTVTLIEERPYLGGRARSFVDRTTGTEIDNGQHLLMGCYTETLGVLRELGTDVLVSKQKALRVVFLDADGTRNVLDASALPGKFGVLMGVLSLRGISISGRLAIVGFALRLLRNKVSVGQKTCLELLIDERQHADAIERFWKPIVLATLNASIEVADAALLVEVLRLAFFSDADNSKLYLPTVGLSALIAPFETWLREHGGEVKLSTSVDTLEEELGKVRGVGLSDGSTLEADAVVLAIPTNALQRLFALSPIRPVALSPFRPVALSPFRSVALSPFRSVALSPFRPVALSPFALSPIVSVYLWYNKHWLDDDFVAMLGTDIQWVFNKTSQNGQLVSLTISAASDIVLRSIEEIIEHCDKELRNAFPSMKGAERVHGLVIKEKTATPLFMPNERQMRVVDRSKLPANVAVAGDWTDTGLPATIEGAARSGVRAVRLLDAV